MKKIAVNELNEREAAKEEMNRKEKNESVVL